jgi:death-on-curing protein
MRYLTLTEIVDLHRLLIKATGGASGIRDLGMLESAIAQPNATFDMNDLYPSLTDKAAVLCFSIVQGHPFVDGNKRTGHAAMATFLLLNGSEIDASLDEQEQIMLALASGQMSRHQFTEWLNQHVRAAADSQGV